MKGMILAAGRGSRMGASTQARPKCLTELGGKPLLQWQLQALYACGVGPLAVVTGYRADQLSGTEYATLHNPRWTETNMVMSMAAAQEWLSADTCVVSYADIVFRTDTVEALCRVDGDIVITYDRLWRPLWEMRFDDPLEDAETFKVDGDGRLMEIGQRAQSMEQIQGQYMGLLKFSPHGWAQIESLLRDLEQVECDKLDMTSLLNRLIERDVRIQTVAVDGGWCEVDNEQDVALYEGKLEEGGFWTHDWRNESSEVVGAGDSGETPAS